MELTAEPGIETLRDNTVQMARQHKASWIKLGQYLFSIHKDKHFREWGFLSFEAYCVKELGIKSTTAQKILKSYAFLEKEEPRVVETHFNEDESPDKVPNYESVNLLRLAKKNESIDEGDYSDLKEAVFDKVREPKDVRAQVKSILTEKEERDNPEINQVRRRARIKRLITILNSAERELQEQADLPEFLIEQITTLAGKLRDQLDEA